MPTTDQDIRDIRPGRRVICHKLGPYDGKRGRVIDVFAGQAKVRFKVGVSGSETPSESSSDEDDADDGDATSSVLYPLEYFEVV